MKVKSKENIKTKATTMICPNSNPKLKYMSGKKTLCSLPSIDLSRYENPNP